MTDRDHFAAAALTGFASQPRFNCGSVLTLTAKQCYELADAMLRERPRAGQNSSGGTESAAKCTERDSATHDAAPAARASEATASPEGVRVRGDAGTGDTQEIASYRRFVCEVMNWISEATSAADWSSDGGRKILADACSRCWDAFDRIAPTDHGASPEARAESDEDRADKAATSHRRDGTGDTPKPISGCVSDRPTPITGPDPDSRVWETHTPATHATQGEGSEQRECTEPVAWAVMHPNDEVGVIAFNRCRAEAYATASDRVVPLYRHPPCQDFSQKNLTLTDAEREAVEFFAELPWARESGNAAEAAVLRGLLERLGGWR